MYKKLSLAFVLFLVLLCGCNKKATTIPVLTESVSSEQDTAVVSRGDVYDLLTYDAKVYPEIKEVSFNINGNLKEIKVYLGQTVQKGDVLMCLDEKALKDELDVKEKELEDIQINNGYNNSLTDLDIQIQELTLKKLQEENASEINIAQTTASYEKAKLLQKQNYEMQQYTMTKKKERLAELRNRLMEYELKSSFSGRVVYIKELYRDYSISAKETVVVITDTSTLHLQSEFIEEAVIKNASQIYAFINGAEYDIKYIPLTSGERSKLSKGQGIVESSYSIKNDGTFAEGDYACICVKNKLKTNVLTIPKNALRSDAQGDFVYLVKEGAAVRRDVEIGTTTNIQVEVISGLYEGDVVYVQG